MKEKFKDSRLKGKINIFLSDEKGYWVTDKEKVVTHIVSICEEYLSDGNILTLRQLYYQLVAKDLVPNHDKVYKKISKIKDDVVYSGLVDWSVFEDRGRVPHKSYYENNVPDALERTVRWYKLDRQMGQPINIEVWTEKDAISGILKKVTDPYTVTLVVNKGYISTTAIYTAYRRFLEHLIERTPVKVLYFGDHDPSGIDMIRDIYQRIMMMFTTSDTEELIGAVEDWIADNDITYDDFAPDHLERIESAEDNDEWTEAYNLGAIHYYIKTLDLFEVIPVGLTMEQINKYNPPHNPAKITDPRAKDYISKYGDVSWEVDALRPDVMSSIVKTAIEKYMDMEIYNKVIQREANDKKTIRKIVKDIQDGEQ